MAATGLRRVAPGLAALAVLATLGSAIASRIPSLDALIAVVAIGVVLGNLVGVPEALRPGVDRYKLLLETGIVLLAASISLENVLASGPTVIALVVGTVLFGIAFVETLARVATSLSAESRSLLAAGASICGVSAVVAVARGIDADGDRLAVVAATVILFDAVTLVAFPIAGDVLGLEGQTFGVWVGLSMFSTGPVAAAGFAHSQVAGQWATITKLVRNALIGVVAAGYALAAVRAERPDATVSGRDLWAEFPKFLVGFAVLLGIANAGVLSEGSIRVLERTSEWLFALAFAGVGLSIRIDEMRSTGAGPALVLLAYVFVTSTLAYVAVLSFL